ncbi:lipid-A-disaccharide synthase [Acidocella sp.]|uniref:lipid-A-disaccharide synthase n=1 Tax=Acidocella sp. TaxID=50710 RepID=UPI0026260F07|nr:lipid-A-disaccharide synthase [Acidocella sp.]
MTKIFILAGEASGDLLGARTMAALKRLRPDIEFLGIGGEQMAREGIISLFPMHDLALLGLAEILPNIPNLRRRLRQTLATIHAESPDILLTIDIPGFALRVLRALGPGKTKRVHYVAPQVWAWRESRVKKYPGLWEELLCLLPFEPDFFAPHGLHPVFTGHPVLESGADQGDEARFRATHNLPANAVPVIFMLGSRRGEISRLAPVFRDTLSLLKPQIPNLVPVLPVAQGVDDTVRAATQDWPVRPLLVHGAGARYDAFAAAHAALTKSGTSTLELAMAGVPMALTYRVNPLSAWLFRRMAKVKYVGIVNILAGRALVPELLQQDCTPPKLAATLLTLLGNDSTRAAQRQGYREVLASLRAPEGTPSEAAAKAILALLAPPERRAPSRQLHNSQ